MIAQMWSKNNRTNNYDDHDDDGGGDFDSCDHYDYVVFGDDGGLLQYHKSGHD